MAGLVRRLGNDSVLALAFLRNGGAARAVLVSACTAVVSSLLFVAVTLVLFTFAGGDAASQPREVLGNLVADRNVRIGYLFGLLVICIAPLALLRQVLRLGTAERERRLAGLRLAGATPADVRRLAGVEVGVPAAAGGLVGYPLFLMLRWLLGGEPATIGATFTGPVARELRLVPTTVEPSWWQVLLVVLLVGLAGAVVGATAGRGVVVSPLGVTRRGPVSAPRPWGLALLLLAGPVFWLGTRGSSSTGGGTLLGVVTVLLLVVGLLALAPWLAGKVGAAVASRTGRPHLLIAARRLQTDPRPAGRAAAAVGVIAMVAGFGGVLITELPSTYGERGFGNVEPMYTVPITLVGVVLLAALAMVVFSLAVHGAESVLDRRRAMASLAALGMAEADVARVQRWEVGLVVLPVAALGLLIGSVPFLLVTEMRGGHLWIPVTVDLVMLAGALLAVRAAVRLTGPWTRRAMAAEQLRTT